MRFHKAKVLSKPEADRIIGRENKAVTDVVVVSRGDRFYDVRFGRIPLDETTAAELDQNLTRLEQSFKSSNGHG